MDDMKWHELRFIEFVPIIKYSNYISEHQAMVNCCEYAGTDIRQYAENTIFFIWDNLLFIFLLLLFIFRE